jgi:hypothetical protein
VSLKKRIGQVRCAAGPCCPSYVAAVSWALQCLLLPSLKSASKPAAGPHSQAGCRSTYTGHFESWRRGTCPLQPQAHHAARAGQCLVCTAGGPAPASYLCLRGCINSSCTLRVYKAGAEVRVQGAAHRLMAVTSAMHAAVSVSVRLGATRHLRPHHNQLQGSHTNMRNPGSLFCAMCVCWEHVGLVTVQVHVLLRQA